MGEGRRRIRSVSSAKGGGCRPSQRLTLYSRSTRLAAQAPARSAGRAHPTRPSRRARSAPRASSRPGTRASRRRCGRGAQTGGSGRRRPATTRRATAPASCRSCRGIARRGVSRQRRDGGEGGWRTHSETNESGCLAKSSRISRIGRAARWTVAAGTVTIATEYGRRLTSIGVDDAASRTDHMLGWRARGGAGRRERGGGQCRVSLRPERGVERRAAQDAP